MTFDASLAKTLSNQTISGQQDNDVDDTYYDGSLRFFNNRAISFEVGAGRQGTDVTGLQQGAIVDGVRDYQRYGAASPRRRLVPSQSPALGAELQRGPTGHPARRRHDVERAFDPGRGRQSGCPSPTSLEGERPLWRRSAAGDRQRSPRHRRQPDRAGLLAHRSHRQHLSFRSGARRVFAVDDELPLQKPAAPSLQSTRFLGPAGGSEGGQVRVRSGRRDHHG